MRLACYDALGNRYLVAPVGATVEGPAARSLCAAHGGDGLLVGRCGTDGAFFLRIFNPDGTEAENSGNGTRSFAQFLRDCSLISENFCEIFPPGGPVRCVFLAGGIISAVLGPASVSAGPLSVFVGGRKIVGHRVDVGNPHFVIRGASIPKNWRRIGGQLDCHRSFPRGTNVEFMRLLSPKNIFLRIYERGVGPTLSCGSGAAAAVAVAHQIFGSSPEQSVSMEGGVLRVSVLPESVTISGPIKRIF
ncbi:MAG: diaminopimelate epimerase [Puniceicoccales bacterium]|jgi:diaminopimelate epimerase|nr:diaminopimelate epimerase [Puniceicoccales bacterium]